MSRLETLNRIQYRAHKSALTMLLKEFAGAPMTPEVETSIAEERHIVAALESKLPSSVGRSKTA